MKLKKWDWIEEFSYTCNINENPCVKTLTDLLPPKFALVMNNDNLVLKKIEFDFVSLIGYPESIIQISELWLAINKKCKKITVLPCT